ncbi:hypothetical protein AcV5_004433 [Taiwanofungus camphoratus]|nr:hypothetical protein AcV5_004433 [Antrodia cinnamomea]
MAQSVPPSQLLKPPIPTNPNSNGNANAFSFIPRKEFIRDPRVISSFSLLALSGNNLVRLYSFPGAVISALRRLFDHQNLIISVREHAPKHFFEFTLDGRPWANPKSIDAEKLIVGILTVVLQCGYSFLSSIDYGREPDDRLAIAFSKPQSVPSSAAPLTSSSAVTLPQPIRTPFAISFASPSVLRVVDPPLHSTPAILQAVRGAWPRGVVSEKKVGDVTYQFKLKGYKIFQEDTFAADSLQQILSLLSTLDSHAFTLLTSMTLTNRSRKQDLWIFTGPADDTPAPDSPRSSPGASSLELKREVTPQPHPYAAQSSNEKLAPIGSYRVGNTAPATSSPLNPAALPTYKAQGNMLRKASPKVQIPIAFMTESESPGQSPVEVKHNPFSSSVGSLDMTGIGSGSGRGGERLSRTPEVVYMTGATSNGNTYGFANEHNPRQAVNLAPQPFPTAVVPASAFDGRDSSSGRSASQPRDTSQSTSHSRGGSSEDQRARGPSDSSLHVSSVASQLQPSQYPEVHVHAPSPVQATVAEHTSGNGYTSTQGRPDARRNKDGSPREPAHDTPRTPTPPLLTPGVFRDSAFSSTTGKNSFEIPIAWIGRDPEPGRATLGALAEIREEEGGTSQRAKERTRERPPLRPALEAQASSFGPVLPGGWTHTPRDEQRSNDIVGMFPPTIKEQPSQEQDEAGHFVDKTKRPERRDADLRAKSQSPKLAESGGERARGNQTGSVDTKIDRRVEAIPRNTLSAGKSRHSPARRETDMSGWVLVNIDRGDKKSLDQGQDGKGKGRDTVSSSPSRGRSQTPSFDAGASAASSQRPQPHVRSSSDSRVPGARSPLGSSKETGAAMSSMSAAAKAIVIIDAIGAKESKQDKSGSGSGFKKMFSKSRDKGARSGSQREG